MEGDELMGRQMIFKGRREHGPSLEGFVYYLNRRSNSKQFKYLKYGLMRLARENPDANPREVIAEFFVLHVHNYEEWLRKLKE